jgi:hypothetical protein
MKRAHRRWHVRLGLALLPVLGLALLGVVVARPTPPAAAELPAAIVNGPVEPR